MSWRVVAVVLAVALLNAALAFDWFGARVVPPPPRLIESPAVPAAPPPRTVTPALPAPLAPPPPMVAAPAPPVAEAPAPEASAQAPASEPAAAPPGCNVAACEAAYQSFRAADCTYQPFDGPRRLCRKR